MFHVFCFVKICVSLIVDFCNVQKKFLRIKNEDEKEEEKGSIIMEKVHNRDHVLFQLIADLKTPEECAKFFEDLCTPKELKSLEQRLDVGIYLKQGLAYLEILEKTGASSATISRVRRFMLDNGTGGVIDGIISDAKLDQPPEN